MRESYKNLHWHEHKTIMHSYPLTDEEKIELAEVMANTKLNISKLEGELSEVRKSYKESIDAESGKLSEAAIKYKSGLASPVEVECDIYQDFENNEMVYVRVEDNTEILRRPMQDNEKRPSLFEMIEGTAKIHNFRE